MSRRSLKVFFLPNEGETSFQVGPRRALRELENSGRISNLEICSFLVEAKRRGQAGAHREILARIQSFQPDIVLWQHVSDYAADREFIQQLRSSASGAVFAYHEADAFDSRRKPYTPQMRAMIAGADIVFQTSLGAMRKLSQDAGARRIHWVPSTFDRERFGGDINSSLDRKFDVILTGNLIRRIPYLWEFPGATQRLQLAKALKSRLGQRFVVFGSGWSKKISDGPVPYPEQADLLRKSWISVIWDHMPENECYFSDRLPISLAAGVPHVTSWHDGYDKLFSECPAVISVRSIREAVAGVEHLLSLDRNDLLALGRKGRDFAFSKFEAGVVFANMIDHCAEILAQRSSTVRPEVSVAQ